MINEDIIAAIATPIGSSGIGIIRISGPGSIGLADKIIRSRSGKNLDLFSAPSHTVHYGFVYDGDRMIDEVLCTVFRAPGSYTAEDTVEINAHGSIFVLNEILSLVIRSGARAAEPGEFTRRAFMNGRIDLTQAEAVMDIISSDNEAARRNSMDQLTGSVKETISGLRDEIIKEAAYIEAALDDPEHYETDPAYHDKLLSHLLDIIKRIEKIAEDSKNVRYLSSGIETVIAGRPNAGKSSLLNHLLGYEKAIVTSVPGTTRDMVEGRISIEGIMLDIIDTAGIRKSEDEAESIGIKRSMEKTASADLILYLIDGSCALSKEDDDILQTLKEKPLIIIISKDDLKQEADETDLKERYSVPVVSLSVKEGKGIDELKALIKDMFHRELIYDGKHIYLTHRRQLDMLERACKSLELAASSVREGMSEDLYTVDMMDAYGYLGSILGEDTDDDLADRIFSEFCMGK